MTAARLAGRGIARRDGELGHLRVRAPAGAHQGLLDLLDDHVLAERVDEVARPPGDHEAERIAGGEAHGVAEQIGPEPARGRQDTAYGRSSSTSATVCRRGRARAEILDRDELVEDSVVEHEREPAGTLGLEPDEALRRGIHLDVARCGRPIHSSKMARYGANETPPWMKTRRFGQHSPRFATGRRPARAIRATRSKRIRSHEGIPEMSRRSWLCDEIRDGVDALVPVGNGRDRPARRIAAADARRQIADDEAGQIADPGVVADAGQRRAPAQEQEGPAQELVGLDPLARRPAARPSRLGDERGTRPASPGSACRRPSCPTS